MTRSIFASSFVALLVLTSACAGRDLEAEMPEEEHSCGGVGDPALYESPTELVLRLRAIARGQVSGALEDYVDRAFAQRLPSNEPLATLFVDPPEGCEPRYSEDPGYAIIAIPPPMDDDTEEEAARIQAIIDELSASTEVTATCAMPEGVVVLYAIAIRRGENGAFQVLAWRDLRNEQ